MYRDVDNHTRVPLCPPVIILFFIFVVCVDTSREYKNTFFDFSLFRAVHRDVGCPCSFHLVYSIRIKNLSFFRVPHLSRVPSIGLLLRRKLVGIGKVDSM